MNNLEKGFKGIEKVAENIIPTYGPKGGNFIIEKLLPPFFIVSNDGKEITDSTILTLTDPEEVLFANVLKEATDKADKHSGNGRKTTSILTYKILKEGMRLMKDSGLSFMELKKEIDSCLPILLDSIDSQKRDITVDEVEKVASIAAENRITGQKIGEIYQHIGKDGIIEVEPSHIPETFYELIEGRRMRGTKVMWGHFQDEVASFTNPRILICKDKIISTNQLDGEHGIITKLAAQGIYELVIYCEDIELSVVSSLAKSHVKGKFKTLVIKAPMLFKTWFYEDLAKITGANAVDSTKGVTFKSVNIEDLGTCNRIVCMENETKVYGGLDISEHIENIKEGVKLGKDESMRVAWLQTKGAILKLGNHSDAELSYTIKKAKDGCSSAYWALQDGVVTGGGVCLLNALGGLPNTKGGEILKEALKTPYDLIYGVKKPDTTVLDASAITKQCIKNAVSIAGTVLTICGACVIPEKIKNVVNANPFPR